MMASKYPLNKKPNPSTDPTTEPILPVRALGYLTPSGCSSPSVSLISEGGSIHQPKRNQLGSFEQHPKSDSIPIHTEISPQHQPHLKFHNLNKASFVNRTASANNKFHNFHSITVGDHCETGNYPNPDHLSETPVKYPSPLQNVNVNKKINQLRLIDDECLEDIDSNNLKTICERRESNLISSDPIYKHLLNNICELEGKVKELENQNYLSHRKGKDSEQLELVHKKDEILSQDQNSSGTLILETNQCLQNSEKENFIFRQLNQYDKRIQFLEEQNASFLKQNQELLSKVNFLYSALNKGDFIPQSVPIPNHNQDTSSSETVSKNENSIANGEYLIRHEMVQVEKTSTCTMTSLTLESKGVSRSMKNASTQCYAKPPNKIYQNTPPKIVEEAHSEECNSFTNPKVIDTKKVKKVKKKKSCENNEHTDASTPSPKTPAAPLRGNSQEYLKHNGRENIIDMMPLSKERKSRAKVENFRVDTGFNSKPSRKENSSRVAPFACKRKQTSRESSGLSSVSSNERIDSDMCSLNNPSTDEENPSTLSIFGLASPQASTRTVEYLRKNGLINKSNKRNSGKIVFQED